VRTGARGSVASLACLGALWLLGCPGEPPPPDIPDCGADTLATQPPLDLLDMVAVGPMGGVDPERGRVWPTQALQLFVRPVDPRLPEGEPARVPVVAPGRIWLLRARHSFFQDRPEELSVTFKMCGQVTWTVEHLVLPSPQVKALADDPGHSCGSPLDSGGETSFCEGTTAGIELAAGTQLGLAGSSTNRTLDVTTRDTRAPTVVFASGRTEKFTCPLDSFDPAAGDALRALLGTPDGRRRTAEPTCGEYMQDVRGTALGNWVNTSDSTKLALVHDNVDPGVAVISMSTPFVESHVWRLTLTHSGLVNRDFGELSPDTIYCYEVPPVEEVPSILLVQVDGTNGLRFERQDGAACGGGPWAFMRAWSSYFVR
jgi:hypothetical protein